MERVGAMHAQCNLPRVFVVDDEPIIASTFAAILTMRGFDATSFTEPREALKAALSGRPDLLISDVMMPLLNGIDLAIRLKAICPNCEVLLFSGQTATPTLLETALANGYDFEVLPKPVHPTDLVNKIQTILESSSRSRSHSPRSIEETLPGVGYF
jgi:DNA-binding NtrC family response regulator